MGLNKKYSVHDIHVGENKFCEKKIYNCELSHWKKKI